MTKGTAGGTGWGGEKVTHRQPALQSLFEGAPLGRARHWVHLWSRAACPGGLPRSPPRPKPIQAPAEDSPKQSSSSSNRQRAGLVLLGPGGTSAWLDKWLRPGAEAWGGGGRVGMLVGARGAGDELLGASDSARSMSVAW